MLLKRKEHVYSKREERIKYCVQFGFHRKGKEGTKVKFANYINVLYKPQFA